MSWPISESAFTTRPAQAISENCKVLSSGLSVPIGKKKGLTVLKNVLLFLVRKNCLGRPIGEIGRPRPFQKIAKCYPSGSVLTGKKKD
eukprot:g57132.t1